MKLIQEAGYSLVTPVLAVNTGENDEVVPVESAKQIQVGDELIRVQ